MSRTLEELETEALGLSTEDRTRLVERLVRHFEDTDESPLARAIEDSRALLSLTANWDEAEGPPLEEATWLRATSFLKRHAHLLLTKHGIRVPTPTLALGPDGSLDLHWKTERRELLLNIPAEGGPASFYGDSYGTNSIKGKLDVESSDLGLLTWLTIPD
jgi:hypothetical protein